MCWSTVMLAHCLSSYQSFEHAKAVTKHSTPTPLTTGAHFSLVSAFPPTYALPLMPCHSLYRCVVPPTLPLYRFHVPPPTPLPRTASPFPRRFRMPCGHTHRSASHCFHVLLHCSTRTAVLLSFFPRRSAVWQPSQITLCPRLQSHSSPPPWSWVPTWPMSCLHGGPRASCCGMARPSAPPSGVLRPLWNLCRLALGSMGRGTAGITATVCLLKHAQHWPAHFCQNPGC